MARAQGSRSVLAAAFESVYGTPPASGFYRMPFASSSLGAEQPLLENELLGFGRDPLAPVQDALDANGNVVIPIDVENMGVWLKALYGQPVTTGAGPYTHTYQSGGYVLPSMAIEVQTPETPRFMMYPGVGVDGISWEMTRKGLLKATVTCIAQTELKATTSQAGVLQQYALDRFGHFNGAIQQDGVALGNVINARINYKNGLESIDSIRADGLIDGIEPTMASLSGSITIRFANSDLFDQAIAGTPSELKHTYTKGANVLDITAHAVYLPRPRVSIDGPKGIEATFDWMGAQGVAPTRMLTAELTNTVATY